jgi:hypothetical protein
MYSTRNPLAGFLAQLCPPGRKFKEKKGKKKRKRKNY